MSISIDGYIFNGDIKEFRKKCIKLLPIVREHKEKVIDLHMEYVKKIKDETRCREYRDTINFLEDGLGLSFELTVYPVKNQLLVQKFKGGIYDKEFVQEIIKALDLKFYGYWDNSDMDDTCSLEEWEQRKEDWTEALQLDNFKSDGRPCYYGFTISLQNKNAIDY